MLCVTLAAGQLVAIDPQPLVPDATNCALVVQGFHELGSDVLQLTPEQGGQIGSAVLLVWAIAFAFRLFIQAISIGDSNVPEDS